MIWFISDTHYHHKNIVQGVSEWTDKSGCRPHATLESHDNWIVSIINDRVGRMDTLYHLGDWSFGGKDKIKEFRDRLNCEKVHLILGNHDHHIAEGFGRRMGQTLLFESCQHYKELAVGGQQLVLMHYPIESWNNLERGSIHLHGHVHGQGSFIQGRVDVGVDAHGIISLDDVAKLPKARNLRHRTIEGGNPFGGASTTAS